MKTIIYNNTIGDADRIINNGGLVAVPTETVYGLAADGMNSDSVAKIYDVKGRPEIKPLSLMVSSVEDINKYCHDVPSFGFKLASNLWPGPATLIFKANTNIPSIVLAGGSTVGLRCPDSALTLELIRKSGCALAAPSANPSGFPSPKCAEDVIKYFDGDIDAIIDGGSCDLGIESTLIDCASENVRILRKGAIDMNIIGITGQTGAGKTSALLMLEEEGYALIDCDSLYHEMLDYDEYLKLDLKHYFPSCFVDSRLDRKKLGEIVFNDSSRLAVLNTVSHNHIICEILLRLFEYKKLGITNIAIDAVELISSGLNSLCNKTIGIIADDDIRLERIMLRDSISKEEALLRIKAQKSCNYYISNCDDVIFNNSTLEDLYIKFKEVLYGKL